MSKIPNVRIQSNSFIGLITIVWMVIAFISGIIFTWGVGIGNLDILKTIFLILSFWKSVFTVIGLLICTMAFMFFPPFIIIGIPQAIYTKYKERKKNENREDGTKNRRNPILN